jgi:hypothetical protein
VEPARIEPRETVPGELPPGTRAFYRRTLIALTAARAPFLVGGAYALERYTGIARHTKDLDVFVRRRDCRRALRALAAAGCQTELTFPHWLAKGRCGDDVVDVIFSSGNGIAEVDDVWFEHAAADHVLEVPVRLCPPEEMIWSKAFIMERERFDGADVAHLIRARAREMDWARLLDRFGPRWRVLLSHLVLFGFIYPGERDAVPDAVVKQLLARLETELAQPPPADRACHGTELSRAQYLVDLERWDYRDARRIPHGNMSGDEIARWTAAIADEA